MEMKCDNWQAWIDTMPPGPKKLHVVGDITVANPGVEVMLVMRSPQGIVPGNLLLELHSHQREGIWTQNVVCKSVSFDRIIPANSAGYTSVTIHAENKEKIAEIKVEIIS